MPSYNVRQNREATGRLNKIINIDGRRKSRTPRYGRISETTRVGAYRRRQTRRPGYGLKWAWAIVVLIAGGIIAADRFHLTDGSMLGIAATKADTLRATFPYCGDARRVNCVVDGDTFWLEGEKIRISDIDTPELSPPRCEAERVKGEAAKRRLQELLNAGPFSLVSGSRDEDQHGRKLRTVTRDGRSIGDMMTEEGLARRWDGARRSWCD